MAQSNGIRYTILVTATVTNEHYEAETKEFETRNRYGGVQIPYPEKERTLKSLEVSLTEDQWSAVKKATLEAF